MFHSLILLDVRLEARHVDLYMGEVRLRGGLWGLVEDSAFGVELFAHVVQFVGAVLDEPLAG